MRVLFWPGFWVLLFWLSGASPSSAQWVDNRQPQAIDAASACASPFLKTFDVVTATTVADVDLGFRASHTWRGDIRARLISSSGTTVELLTPNTGAGGNLDNYNIRLDDEATVPVNTGTHASNDDLNAPDYAISVQPNNALSAFDGQSALGTWTLEICDDFPGADDGQFERATLFITPVVLPSPPDLICAAGPLIPLDWSAAGTTNGWTAGTLSNGYSAGSIPVNIALSGATGQITARNGSATPVTATEFTGAGTQYSVLVNSDFTSTSQAIVFTINLGLPAEGVGGVEFKLLDVDRGGWTDRVAVTASLDGAAVPVTLTAGLANGAINGGIEGTASSAAGQSAGNMTVSLLQPADQLVLTYTSGAMAPANPSAQVISFFADFRLCPRAMTELTAVKSIVIDDPSNAGDYMTPGSTVIYKIAVTNGASANASAEAINILDTLPDSLRFVSADATGFTGGAFGTPDLPPANTDCGSMACTIRYSGASLPPDSTGEIRVTALIK